MGRMQTIAKSLGQVAYALCDRALKITRGQVCFQNFPGGPPQRRSKCPDFAFDKIDENANARDALHVLVNEQIEVGHQLGDFINNANKLALAFTGGDRQRRDSGTRFQCKN